VLGFSLFSSAATKGKNTVDNLKEEFKKIFEKIQCLDRTQKFEWFQACGRPDLKHGFMVVGRAVNSWKEFTADKKFEDLYEPEPSPLEESEDGGIASFFSRYGYNINGSAFWRTVRSIAKGLYPCDDGNFGKKLIYSNLYKIALPGQNPPPALQKLQLLQSINILRKEILFWEPSFILFLTDWNWAEPFLTAPEMNFTPIISPYDQLKACGILFNGCRIAVIPHPQGKKERLLAGQTIAFFHDFEKLYAEIASVSGGLERKWYFNSVSEEILFSKPPIWNHIPLPLLIQTDLNLQCFRVGIWSRDKIFLPLCQILSQKLNRAFQCNSAWTGGYTEVKFCIANDATSGLVKLVRDIYQSLRVNG